MDTLGGRLREERTRLGMSQEQFGALGGVRKQAQIKYEKGERKPDSAYFEGIAAAGADIGFILTGQPSEAGPAKLEYRLGALKTTTEKAHEFSALSPRKQMLVRDILFGVAISESALLDQTIDNYVAEEAAAYGLKDTGEKQK